MLKSIGIISDAPASSSTERWAPVAGHGGFYEVSDQGRVLSHKGPAPKILRQYQDRHGHLRVALYSGGRSSKRFAHRLVLQAFVGDQPPGMEVRHLDGNPTNNALENLAYGTRSQNMLDKKWHRTARSPTGKLFGHEASEIKVRLRRGARGADLAREFGVSKMTVSRIKHGYTHRDA